MINCLQALFVRDRGRLSPSGRRTISYKKICSWTSFMVKLL